MFSGWRADATRPAGTRDPNRLPNNRTRRRSRCRSQSILGSFTEDELPAEATMSAEVDILLLDSDNTETARLADLIEGVAGEWSPFEEQHGFSIDGVDLDTAILPTGWRDRLIRVQNANTAALSGNPQYTGWCLDKEDLCVAKLCALREKDRNFVAALLDARLVDAAVITRRLSEVPTEHHPLGQDQVRHPV